MDRDYEWAAPAGPAAPAVGPDVDALGAALEAYRTYLTRVAGHGLGPDLSRKLGASDIVQETFLAAHVGAHGFRGGGEDEWRGWLERILKNRLANARRHYRGAAKRSVGRESSLPGDDSGRVVAAALTTPSGRLTRLERERALLAAVDSLPDHYRLVLRWHHEERLTFEQVAARMGTTPEAARKLWGRALVRLRSALGPSHDPR